MAAQQELALRLLHALFDVGLDLLAQRDVGQRVTLIDFHLSGDKHRGSLRRERFDFCDQLRAIDAGHDQIGQHKIDVAAPEL